MDELEKYLISVCKDNLAFKNLLQRTATENQKLTENYVNGHNDNHNEIKSIYSVIDFDLVERIRNNKTKTIQDLEKELEISVENEELEGLIEMVFQDQLNEQDIDLSILEL
jgi:hypothetical protein